MKRICLAAIAVGGLFMFTACGSDDTARDAPAGAGQEAGQQGSGQRGMPGASGKIAAADGSTLQVQGSDSQTAVTYTDKTAITQQVTGSLSDVKAGLCVTVTPADGSESSETAVTAGSIRVTEKTDGSCQGGFGGGRPSGMPEGGMPSGMPEGEMPSGAPEGGMPSGGPGGGGFGTSGEVTAVSGDTITVAATRFDPQAEEGAEPETTTVTVTTTGETTVTTTKTADATALSIGRCVTANGTADDTGAVSAERIEVSDAVDGECSTGFGRGGFPGSGSQDGASS